MTRLKTLAAYAALGVIAMATPALAAPERIALLSATRQHDKPRTELRVGNETRPLLAPSGREALAILPAEVGAGGRLFAYAPVPAQAVDLDFAAEALVWRPGRDVAGAAAAGGSWRRIGLISRKAGAGETVSVTTVDPELDTGPVLTALYLREPQPEGGRAITTAGLELPRGARLDFAYAIDEFDARTLAPVTVTVTALVAKRKSEEVERIELLRREIEPAAAVGAWTDLSLGLGKLSGENVAFEFRSVSNPVSGALATHVAWTVPVIVHEARGSLRPAVVVVSLGNVRAASTGCCGGERSATPFLDASFAGEGATFRRALTESVTFVAAHMTLLTATSPCRHGVRAGGNTLDVFSPTIAQRFASAGYATAGFSDGGGLVAELGFAKGFDVYVELDDARASATLERALAWLSSRGAEPVFVFVHTAQALRVGGRDAYEREVSRIDAALRDFLVNLDQVIDPDRLILAITSGHGEEFGEHAAFGHGTQLYEESIAVPMLLRGGGVKRGLRPSGVFGLIDVGPTLLQLAGLDAPLDVEGVGHAAELRAGVSWSSEVRFAEATAKVRKSEAGVVEAWKPPGYAAIEGPLKLIRDGDSARYLAFNVLDDVVESRDVLATHEPPSELQRLREALDAHAAACEESHRAAASAMTLMPRSREVLSALGYLD